MKNKPNNAHIPYDTRKLKMKVLCLLSTYCNNVVSVQANLCDLASIFIFMFGKAYSPPTHTGAHHPRTVSTNTGCNKWLSLAEPSLKVALADRNQSLVACTNMCVCAINFVACDRPNNSPLVDIHFVSDLVKV